MVAEPGSGKWIPAALQVLVAEAVGDGNSTRQCWRNEWVGPDPQPQRALGEVGSGGLGELSAPARRGHGRVKLQERCALVDSGAHGTRRHHWHGCSRQWQRLRPAQGDFQLHLRSRDPEVDQQTTRPARRARCVGQRVTLRSRFEAL